MNILNKTKIYEIGHMQYGNGRGWRDELRPFLENMGITVFDPYDKPFMNAPEEDENTHKLMAQYMENEQYDLVAEHFKKVRAFDLSMVDKSDFVICYLDTSVFTVGTIEELCWAAGRLKRPTFIIIEGGKKKAPLWLFGLIPHKYIYNNFEEVKDVLTKINSGEKEIDSDRWRLLKEGLR